MLTCLSGRLGFQELSIVVYSGSIDFLFLFISIPVEQVDCESPEDDLVWGSKSQIEKEVDAEKRKDPASRLAEQEVGEGG